MEGTVLANFRHAIRLQKAMEFDRARASYDLVLNFAPDNAEALWGRLLCHYGAAPVSEDGRNFYMIHRPDEMVPLREQPDYEYACQLADPALRSQIQEEAAYIDRAILRIRHMAETKPDFDIFICHKCSHPEGGYTEDYKRANNLYMRLKDKGYRVFFAPLEMEKHAAGEDYEAMIYHALKTSKVMLVVCSDSEYLHSKWVQAEWLRFLRMMSGDDEKRLIPLLYGGMDPCRLPKHFQYRHLQCINMEGDGYELVEQNVEKIIRKCGGESGEEPPPPPPPRKSGGWILLLVLALLAAAAAGAYFLRNEGGTACEHLHSSWQTKASYKSNNSVYHTVTEVQTKVCNDCGKELQRMPATTREEAHVYVDSECQHCGVLSVTTLPVTTPPVTTPPVTTPPVTTPPVTTPPVTTPPVTTPPVTTPPVTTPPATPTPSPTPTPTPIAIVSMTMDIAYNEDSEIATVSWSSVSGAVKYRVKRAKGKDNERGDWTTIQETSAMKYADDGITGRMYSTYQVEAIDRYGNVIGRSTERSVYAATWGPRIWTEIPPKEDGVTRIVDRRTQYQYRDQEVEYSPWSSWSLWTMTRREIADSNLMREEMDVKYKWWAAKCNICGRHNPYHGSKVKCYGCGITLYNDKGLWSNAFYYSDHSSGSELDGRSNGRIYDGNRYWLTSEKVTVYRYKTRSVSYGWSECSAWQDEYVEETSTRKVNRRTLYCYQKLE